MFSVFFLSCFCLIKPSVSTAGNSNTTYHHNVSTFNHSHHNTECSPPHGKSNETTICVHVKEQLKCNYDHGYISYIHFPYCYFSKALYPLAYILMFLWLIYLFIGLAITAEEFFCPCLKSISKTLKMSDSVAGVTLLALGNGAPDIFTVVTAVNSEDLEITTMAFQELFGAGIFVTTVVSGFINLSASFKLARRPFLRDVLFYCTAVAWTVTVMYKRDIKTMESVGFIVLYVTYASIVIIGQCVNRLLKRRLASQTKISTSDVSIGCPDHDHHIIEDLQENADFVSYNYSIDHAHLIKEKLHSCNTVAMQPYEHISNVVSDSVVIHLRKANTSAVERLTGVTLYEWAFQNWFSRLYTIIKVPIILIMSITTPVVDLDVQGQKWNKYLVCSQCIVSPLFCAFAVNGAFKPIYKEFVVWHLLLILGCALMLVVLRITSTYTTPRYNFILAFSGFFVAVLWIKTIAQEIVNLLQTFGWIFGLTYGVMGLTLLAWGNSVGDFMSNLTMARHGAPRMAIAACYGGPLLNMLLGVGVSCTISSLAHDGHKPLIRGTTQYIISAFFLALSLFSALILLPLAGFHSSKYIGLYFLLLYCAYLLLSILHETDVFHIKP